MVKRVRMFPRGIFMAQNQSGKPFVPEPNTIVVEDDALREGFVQLPKRVLFAGNLSYAAKLLYAVMLGYAWQEGSCFPGYLRLCRDMAASENMVRKYMRELQAIHLISQRRRGQGKTNIYILNKLRTANLEVQENENSRTSDIEVQEPHQGEVLKPQILRSNNKQYNNTQNENKQHVVVSEKIEKKDIINKLTGLGIAQSTAYRIASKYPQDYLLEKIDEITWVRENLPERVSNNPGGYAHAAIKERYDAPPGYKSRHQRASEKERRELIENCSRCEGKGVYPAATPSRFGPVMIQCDHLERNVNLPLETG